MKENPPERYAENYNEIRRKRAAAVAAFIKSGKTMSEAAEEFGVTKTTISRDIHKVAPKYLNPDLEDALVVIEEHKSDGAILAEEVYKRVIRMAIRFTTENLTMKELAESEGLTFSIIRRDLTNRLQTIEFAENDPLRFLKDEVKAKLKENLSRNCNKLNNQQVKK